MKFNRMLISTTLAGVVAVATLGFAPVPSTAVYHGQYLFAEDGTQVKTRVAGETYEVAAMNTVPVAHLQDAKPHYGGALAVLDRRGKIIYFRNMSEPRMVNAIGRYAEVNHKYASLVQLRTRLDAIIKHAANHY